MNIGLTNNGISANFFLCDIWFVTENLKYVLELGLDVIAMLKDIKHLMDYKYEIELFFQKGIDQWF
jgi:hypothetical protein